MSDEKQEENSNLDLSKEINAETPKAEETSKVEETPAEPVSWADMEQLKKFGGDVDKLANSYLELQKKMSSQKPAKDMTDAELVEFNKKFYGDLSESKSSLEGEMAEISEKTAQELGIATKLSDAVAAKVHKSVASKLVSQRVKKAEEMLSDSDTRNAVINAVKAEGGEYAEKFSDRLKSGDVSVQELTLLSKNGKIQVEAELGLEGEKTEVEFDNAEKELYNLTENYGHVWGNPNHPEHFKMTQKISKLKRTLGI